MTELQEKVLNMLKIIDYICRQHNIQYYLTSGTLIGALRHKGFIPWDDDADLIMTRANWEKFFKYAKGQLPDGLVLNSPYDNPNLATTVGHCIDTSTASVYRYHLTNPEETGVVVDIIIMDFVPDNEKARQMYLEALYRYTDLSVIPYVYSTRAGKSSHFGFYWALSKVIGKRKTLEMISRTAFHFPEKESDLVVQCFAGAPHFWPKTCFGEPKYVPFEDTMLPVPARAEDCLCIGYDDEWMFIPADGNTKSTHEFCVRSLTTPGSLIAKDFEKHIDRKELMRTYVKRKKIMVSQTKNKFRVAMESDQFLAAYIQLIYKKKDSAALSTLLKNKDFEGLEAYFSEYIKAQCTSHFLGSSSLEGWLNWYRKCNPMLIDIGDDALYAALVLLMHKQKLAWIGKLLKARKSLDRPMTRQMQEMDELYHAIKDANSAYECEEDNRCRAILAQWLPRHPDNAFLWKLDLKESARHGLAGQDLLDAASSGLEMFPNDPEILNLKAEAYFSLGSRDNALEIYRFLAETTNHGLVLLHIKERLELLISAEPENRAFYEIWLAVRKQMGEVNVPKLETFFPAIEEEVEGQELTENIPSNEERKEQTERHAVCPSALPVAVSNQKKPALTSVQEKRLQLLSEVAEICRENKIKYFLIGKALLQAARGGRYIDQQGDLVIAMTPANCEKFTQAFKLLGRKDRYLDSMAETPRFHRFCVRYCDNTGLDFEIGRSGCGEQFGIFVTIEILRNPAQKKLVNLVDQMLESGWESTLTMKWISKKRFVSWFAVSVLCMLFGRKNVSKWLYHRFMKGPKKKVKNQYYLKPFWGKRIYYPSYLFKYVRGIKLGGHPFTTVKLFAAYLKQVYGAKWKTRKFPLTKAAPFTRIVDINISSQEYLAFLQEKQIDRVKIWKLRNKTNWKYARANTLGTKTGRYWDIMCLCGERYRLLEKYAPMRTYIIELFRSNRVAKLTFLLKDYYRTAVAYSKKNLGICFDKKIFEIMEYCLFAKGKVKQARKLRRLILKQDWAPIYLDPENIREVSGMKEATANDVPAILVYLKRHVRDCLYMYIDIGKYGLSNPNMKVWFDEDNRGIKLVVMKYHTNISVYSDVKDWDVSGVADIIKIEDAGSVTGKKELIERLHEHCDKAYSVSYGAVYKFSKHHDFDFDATIETAAVEDTMEIAELIAQDEGIGSYYEVKDLADQLAERIRTNMGRSYIIRENGKIIAHIASYAEFDGLATTGGLIVDASARGGAVYGSVLESYLVRRLAEEHFQIYTFVTSRIRKKLLAALGNQCVGEYGKMTRAMAEG